VISALKSGIRNIVKLYYWCYIYINRWCWIYKIKHW